MEKELSIIITSYKNPAILKLCIQSLRKNIKNIIYEIIVVDGATGEETFDLMREQFSEIQFIPNKNNLGFHSLVNQGMKVAKGRYYFIINSDIIVKDDSIEKLLSYFKKNKKSGIVGPKLMNFDNTVQPSCFHFYSALIILYRRTFLKKFSFVRRRLSHFLMEDKRSLTGSIKVDWLMGSAMMTSRTAVDKVGGLDGRFFMYFEDVDWCWRFWQAGYEVVYYPLATMYHYHGKKSAGGNVLSAIIFNKYTRIHIRSAIKFFIKHFWEKKPH